MNNFALRIRLLTVILIVSFSQAIAQDPEFSKELAKQLTIENAASIGLSQDQLESSLVSDAYINRYANTKMVYLQQTYKGVPVYNAIRTIAFKNEKVVSSTGLFVPKIAENVNLADARPVVIASAAVAAAANNVNRPIKETIAPITEGSLKIEFPSYGVSQKNITAKLLWVPTNEGAVSLCWQVKFVPVNSSDYWLINVDAKTGEVISKDNLTVYEQAEGHAHTEHTSTLNLPETTQETPQFSPLFRSGNSTNNITATYKVSAYPAESPSHTGGVPIIVNDPWLAGGTGNLATTLGWHNDGVADHDSTRGNNVWAREDRKSNNGLPVPGRAAKSTTAAPSLTFDFTYNDQLSPTNINNQNFAITQLFYWNNIMHDVIYQYGFDEVSGNFQNANLGRGGNGNDYVIADAQDGAGTNNANFATPDDGEKPRMQMFLFNPSNFRTVKVISPPAVEGFKQGVESDVSSNNKLTTVGPVAGTVVYYGTPGNNQGCNQLTGTPLAGKIALIDEGNSCANAVKIKNAQLAGAIGVIMVKSTTGAPTVMTGLDNTITKPAVMISFADGNAIKSAIGSGEPVDVSLSVVNLDGDLDNGIMAHEYGHGISNRLTGGPGNSSCLTNKEQMGEGWSDYYSLVTTTDWSTALATDGPKPRGIGTFAFGQLSNGAGIRRYPYSTSMVTNPWTYGMLATGTGGGPHAIGEVWSSAIWDMTWNIIQTNGINANLYDGNANGGNSIAMKLVTEGMKLQPCRPGFLDGRDGILRADTIMYNGQYSCAIWKAFARRGMGIKAKQGSSDSYTDQVADFTLPSAVINKTVDKAIADQNEEITYTLKTSCQCQPISNFKIVDTLDNNVTYVSGGTYNPANRTVTFDVPSLTEGQTQSFQFTARVNVGTHSPAVTLLNEEISTSAMPPTFTAASSGTGAWTVSSTRSHSGTYSYKAVNSTVTSRQVLISAASYPITGLSTLSFWHYFNTENQYDGGYVELNISGNTWFDAGPYITQNGYNSQLGVDSRGGYAGTSGGQFIQTKIDLSAFKNKSIRIRFVFITDANTGGDGWYVDDINLTNASGVYNIVKLFNSTNEVVSLSDTATLITANLPVTWGAFTAKKDGKIGLLTWTTLQEQNTAEFIVERSTNGTAFEKIATVRAAGNTTNSSTYNANDNSPAKGTNYYRIKQVDKDGKFTYSEIRSLNFSNNNGAITISPNPAKDYITLSVPGNSKLLQVNIFSSKGEKVGTYNMSSSTSTIKLPHLSSGVYYVSITGNDVTETQKLVIK